MTQENATILTTVEVPGQEAMMALYGSFDENMQVLETECGVKVRVNDRELTVEGENDHVQVAVKVLEKMLEMIARKEPIDKSRVRYAISLAREGQADLISQMMGDVVLVTYRGRQIKCRTVGQKKYIDAIRKNSLVFAVGPAGTGKTYLAMAMACLAIKNKEVSRIVLTRPAVEAGEKLGFLPGDLQNKVDPYLRPLYDALYDMLGQESYARLQEKGVIEVAPMAYMRGRTLNDAFIVLDEAQNTTPEQMKMFLTRMGQGSRMVITGDVTQIDLPPGKISGLVDATSVLSNVPGIEICRLTAKDVVRHEMVQAIIQAYEKRDKRRIRDAR
jgi:phosphate starvation-inducible PhoH-like protein